MPRKEAFNDQARARKVARRMKRNRTAPRLHEYHCKDCGKWHIGTAIAPKKLKPRVEE